MNDAPTLRQLEYIVAVAEHGGFVAAAHACAVSQPALSRQVRDVEERLGAVIFERARPRVLVTAEGARIVAQARRVLAEARALVSLGQASADPFAGRIELGVIPTLAPYVLPPLLVAIGSAMPRLEVALHELRTTTLLERLGAGELDVALLAVPVDGDDFDGRDLFDEPFVLAAPRGHVLDRPGAASLDELAGASLLLLEEGHCLRDHALDVCARFGAAANPALRAASMTTLALMVRHGLGASLLPALSLDAELGGDHGSVALRSFGAGVQPSRRVSLRWRRTSARVQACEAIAALAVAGAPTWASRCAAAVRGPAPSIRLVDASVRGRRSDQDATT